VAVRRVLSKTALMLLASLAAAVVTALWLSRPQTLTAAALPAHQADPQNGELLFHAGGCASCHGARLEGGLELVTAFGTFRVPNITPDREAGIGGWSTLDFINAMKRGVRRTVGTTTWPYASTRMSLATWWTSRPGSILSCP
jgi:mono/diheme cytochrome c family protein